MSYNIEIPMDQLQKRKLMICTPMYGGNCCGTFAKSIADLSAICAQHGIQLKLFFLFNESLIQRARNYCCDEFMRSGDDHLMFIDSDIGFNPVDVIAMMAMQSKEGNDFDILCGAYPKKTISWEKIRTAVEKGFADEDPTELDKFVGDFVFNPANGTTEIRIDQPAEVMESGTGFMMIKRSTFEKFSQAYPGQLYRPDHVRTEHFDGTREIMAYFDCPIDPVSKRYLSEDYMFCQWSRAIGLKVWLCPWIKLIHFGSFPFGGSLADLARVGVAATADPSQLRSRSTNAQQVEARAPKPLPKSSDRGKKRKTG